MVSSDVPYSPEAAKAVLAAIVLALLWMAEGVWPMFAARRHRASHYVGNLLLGLVNGAVSAFLFAGALYYATEWSRETGFGLLHRFAAANEALVLVAALVLIDAWQYAWHVANHKVRWLWRFHAIHHSDGDLDASSGFRFHAGEVVLSGSARLLVLPLLGVTMPQLAIYEVIVLPIVLFHHSNVRVPGWLDRALRVVIVTPGMHWVHHSDWQPETDSNFSSLLSVWDRCFRTFRLRESPQEIRLGLSDFPEDEWRSIRRMMAAPVTHAFPRSNDPRRES